ncbi:phosphotransferase enzyme family protein [Calothrix sp. CCY 0018]|uniref:phosphotransferase enzyme family protein n=1 Tax=Calothrix sp. CCY 0018 TaxID=3103864 RepID=UPI0039C62420
MTQIYAYKSIAKAALNQYDLADEKIQFLGHSENVTFCVEAAAEKFLLRIHQPVSASQDDIWQQPDIIESELLWLAALHRDRNINVVVQKPIQNQQGEWVTQVLADNKDIFCCSLLRWIDGNISETRRTSQQAHQLGLIIAQLHQHSSQWKLPQNFIRPTYDENRLHAALEALYPAVSNNLISAEHYELLTTATHYIETTMKTLGRSQHWGLIHADLHESNYLFDNQQIRPIDFSRCGFGYYLYDLAQSIDHFLPQIRSSFFAGYQTIRNLPDNYLQITEGFSIMASIEVFAFHANNPKEHEWLSNTVKYVAQKHIPKFLQGESFLLDII